jgi:hypothetical protein
LKRKQSSAGSLNVLFIGNSFTARNDLPGMIAKLAAAAGGELNHQLISVGGASLRMHWNRGEASRAIERRGYDFVVLQEQSTLPVKNAARMHENVRLFDGAVRGAGSRTALYMTWARRHSPEAQDAISQAYTSIGQKIGATVVPVGLAWAHHLRSKDPPVLHDKDGSHPSLAGTYLAACVFVATLFGVSPESLETEIPGISAADRQHLHRAALAATSERG